MTTIHIPLDDSLADALRRHAESHGKSIEAVAAELLSAQAANLPTNDRSWVDAFLRGAETTTGDSGGWKWNRDELYDR